jgi:hypothetical protein
VSSSFVYSFTCVVFEIAIFMTDGLLLIVPGEDVATELDVEVAKKRRLHASAYAL